MLVLLIILLPSKVFPSCFFVNAASASKFIELAIKESDNNIKLIVLDKLNELHQENEGVLEDLVMEILRVLSSPDIDVRNKALEIALKMVTSRNVEEVIGLLKKDLIKTIEQDYEKVPSPKVNANVEQRIPPIANPRNPYLRNPLLGSCIKWNPLINGLHQRIQQYIRSRRNHIHKRSRRKIPRPPPCNN